MSVIGAISNENCRTCLCFFNETNKKCSLLNCLNLTLDSTRFEILKNLMESCSLTVLNNQDNQNSSDTFICMSCVVEIDRMLNFFQKCIKSEAILKQNTEVKTEDTSIFPKVEIKIEGNDENVESTSYECQECHKVFSSSLLLSFHKYKHKPHTCHVCRENFKSLKLIKEHMKSVHGTTYSKPYLCRQCPDVFVSKQLLLVHERRIHNTKKYSCGVCKRTFSTVSSLKFHENIHLGQRFDVNIQSDLFKCHCGKSFNRKKKLDVHVETVHEKKSNLKSYSCLECDKKFSHPYSLKNHMNIHLGIKPFLCSVCGSAFTAQSNLTGHFKRLHSEDKQPKVKKYLCHTCGDPFARASHLQRHTLRKHVPNAEKKHECPICKKKFLEKSDVAGHIKLHDDVKPFVCDQCSKCFRTAWRLQAHIKRVHLGLRPFECLTCSVKFKTKSHLEKHIRTHTGEKPFSCPHCVYTCAEKSNLKKHINIHLKGM